MRIRVDTPEVKIAQAISDAAQSNAVVRKEVMLFSRKVQRYWKRIAPVGDSTGARYVENFGGPLPKHWSQTDDEAGSYRAGIIRRRGRRINGFPSWVIAATDYKSHWIEYGTGGDTPTPEFAPRQRTATRFGALTGVQSRKAGVNRATRRGAARRYGVTGLGVAGRPSGQRGKPQGYEPVPDEGAA